MKSLYAIQREYDGSRPCMPRRCVRRIATSLEKTEDNSVFSFRVVYAGCILLCSALPFLGPSQPAPHTPPRTRTLQYTPPGDPLVYRPAKHDTL